MDGFGLYIAGGEACRVGLSSLPQFVLPSAPARARDGNDGLELDTGGRTGTAFVSRWCLSCSCPVVLPR